MTEILLAVGVIVGLVLMLSFVVMGARALLAPERPVTITVNGNRDIVGTTGRKLLGFLNDAGVAVPSACAGAGTCGQCKVKLLAGGGEPLPTETALLGRSEIREGRRLSCQVVVRGPLSIEVPDDILAAESWTSEVLSTTHVAPLIRELVLGVPDTVEFDFKAGSYVQIEAPAYDLDLANLTVAPKYEAAWKELGVRELRLHNPEPTHRAYSIASRPRDKRRIVLDIRLALPPSGQGDIPPGIVSSYLFSLKPGDKVGVSGPFGDFHVQDTDKEMIFIGGGVGMAPLRAMIHEQLAKGSKRKISFWYGARSGADVYYRDEFDALSAEFENFSWTLALSEPMPEDHWAGSTGFIHEVVRTAYLKDHPAPHDCEYYLCGPPLMIAAVIAMLDENGVDPTSIFNDDFGI
ncbi:NADH:ubiquinone reductase (Na(+)-transporting) subunit F [Cucumibacter marinus]|uniref:NADH:ubiquinone reductase (Na(+)-transporting) subunit F n=1 Tax=Cucumibacter marinus TaxID=1121252 RepID=UPI0003F80D0B|nr:NADH:ubiquinone reductase (Na(+)-transporting) subunit F [Cucumibacter marinus]